ncbi:ABC transporter permease [Paenalcaligenes sp. Me52]|uniref:ABC transporter permease n=1 Tax=Paenalcaligenes sp. Me52 TaxID=3392038 RepID=UPI003D2D7FBD
MNSSMTLSTADIKKAVVKAHRKQRWQAAGLLAPLAIFLLVIFVIPVAALLFRAVDNPEVIAHMPRTLLALKTWDQQNAPPAESFVALATDLQHAKDGAGSGLLARRLNYEIAGYRTLIFKTVRKMPLADIENKSPEVIRDELIAIDPRWGEVNYWRAIANNDNAYSDYYLLASLDLKRDTQGDIVKVPEGSSAFQDIFARTFEISLGVTVMALLLGFPLAYWMSRMSARSANLVMICVLIPFWTSVLVRIAAWIVLLQRQGLINKTLMELGFIDVPLDLLFNRVGVYIAMVHIMLPFMVLPIYSVMRSIPPTYQRAAISLGSHPFAAFWKVYVPQTYPGVAAGCLLVFIISIGYYITPALLGGANDQMISYYVAYFTNQTINWGMASALGFLLLAGTLVLYTLYRRLSGRELGLG